MTNAQEMAYMKSEKGLNEIARNIYQGIRDYSDYVLQDPRCGGGPAGSGRLRSARKRRFRPPRPKESLR